VAVSRTALTARAAIATAAGPDGRTRITVLRSDGPIALRDTPAAVYLIGAAAGPMGDDDLSLDIDVAPGTSLTLRSAASSILLPGQHGGQSRLRIRAQVGAHATLDFCLQPTVAAAGSHHRTTAEITLDPTSHLRWREELILGRHNEPSGRCVSRLDVVIIGDVPLYRSDLVVGSAETDRSSAVLHGAAAAGSVLLAGQMSVRSAATSTGLAVLPLAGPGTAITATAPDASTLSRRLDQGELLASLRHPATG
jgi:urease accessory protein